MGRFASGEGLPALECSEGHQSLAEACTLQREGREGVGVGRCGKRLGSVMSPGGVRTGSFQRLLGSCSHRSPHGWLASGERGWCSGPEWTVLRQRASAKAVQALTQFALLARGEQVALLMARPLTGRQLVFQALMIARFAASFRTHQIRVHVPWWCQKVLFFHGMCSSAAAPWPRLRMQGCLSLPMRATVRL